MSCVHTACSAAGTRSDAALHRAGPGLDSTAKTEPVAPEPVVTLVKVTKSLRSASLTISLSCSHLLSLHRARPAPPLHTRRLRRPAVCARRPSAAVAAWQVEPAGRGFECTSACTMRGAHYEVWGGKGNNEAHCCIVGLIVPTMSPSALIVEQ